MGGSGGPAGVEEDEGSDEVALTSVVGADPASVWVAEALPEGMVTAEVVRLFPCWPGDTWTRRRKKLSWMSQVEELYFI